MTKKLLVIGLDGASFNVLDPLIEKGYLPNLAKLIEGGARADLDNNFSSDHSRRVVVFYDGKESRQAWHIRVRSSRSRFKTRTGRQRIVSTGARDLGFAFRRGPSRHRSQFPMHISAARPERIDDCRFHDSEREAGFHSSAFSAFGT